MGQMSQIKQEDYPPGTIVFAKLKGYPWWPARVSCLSYYYYYLFYYYYHYYYLVGIFE